MNDIARKTAFGILLDYEKKGTYPHLALKSKLRDIESRLDRSFVTNIVYGTIAKKLTLDYYVSKVSSVRLSKIDLINLTALRMGLYQIIYMSVPASAACNTSVELVKKNGMSKSAGFVNAILRRLSAEYRNIAFPQDETERACVEYSVSKDVYRLLTDSIGADAAKSILTVEDHLIYAAVNTLKTNVKSLIRALKEQGVDAEPDMDGLIRFPSCGVEGLTAFQNGLFHVIGKPSYISARLFAPEEGQTAIDMCSAPGGKAFTAAYLSNDKSRILAYDLHKHKIGNIMSSAKRLGLKSVIASQADGTVYNGDLSGTADRVLCDVPCSGLGIIPKKPDIRYKSIDCSSLTETQLAILKNGASYLKNGGRLVYSTCTVNTAENRGVIDRFLEEYDQFEIDKSVHIYDNVYGEKLFLPDGSVNEGFYIAVLKKR